MKVGVKQVIKLIIESKKCPLHGRYPVVDNVSRRIKITTCCNAFHEQCSEQVNSILSGIDTTHHWKVA